MPSAFPEKRKRGRPRRVIPLHLARIRMDKPVWQALQKLTRQQGTTPSGLVRRYVEKYVKQARTGGNKI